MEIENPISKEIWQDRYSKNGESVDDNLKRVAKFCSQTPSEEKDFYDVMRDGLFFPAGRTMSNAGICKELTLNNCFTLNFVEDSISAIFETVKNAAITHQRGGGTGFEFSKIRPKGTPTSNDAVASGVVSFMDVFNAQTSTIMQGGRRGANMGILSIYHPDIYEYLNSKSFDEGRLTHFNLSIMVDDAFMEAKNLNEKITLHYPIYDEKGHMIKDSSKWTHSKEVNANELWNLIMEKAYNTGEYGVFFYENLNNDNNTWYMETIVTTNPCGEYTSGLLYGEDIKTEEYYGACNLGSLFLHRFVNNPFTKTAYIDYEKLKNTIKIAVRFLDNIIDVNRFPHKNYENYQKNMRTIGLGISGLGDLFAMMGMKYGDIHSIKTTENLMEFITLNAYKASIGLADEKGAFNFLNKEKFIQSGFIQKHLVKYPDWQYIVDGIREYGIRNARLISIAPCGTLSLTFGENCSSGIEPIFSLEYKRKIKMGGQSEEDIRLVDMKDYAYKLWQETKEDNIVDKDVFVTAMDLSVAQHIDILKTVAFHTDMSISKTINIPSEYTFEDTKRVYDECWKSKIKGCTIFRPNLIRQGILITNPDDKKVKATQTTEENYEYADLPWGTTISASDDLIGRKTKLMSGCGALHLQAWFEPYNGRLMEVFLSKGSTGGCASFMGGLSRMTSLALRTGADFEVVIDQLKSAPACPSYVARAQIKKDCSVGSNCPSAIANALVKMHKEVLDELGLDNDDVVEIQKAKIITKSNNESKLSKDELQYLQENGEIAFAKKYHKCPVCGEVLNNLEGCLSCVNCGFSKCG